MPWVLFTAPFDFHVKPNVTISYRPGGTYLVKQRCADEAIKAGKAVATQRRKAIDHAKPAGR